MLELSAPGDPRVGRRESAAQYWARWSAATAGEAPPYLVLDIDAFTANARDLARRAAPSGKPIRVASKSLRSRELLAAVLREPGFSGVLAYTLEEAIWLAGEHEDVLVAYPTTDASALERLTSSEALSARITLMIDCVGHLDLIDARRGPQGPPTRVALDLDTAAEPPLMPRIGALRSPLRDPADVGRLAREVRARSGFRLVGAMSYEAHIAGLGDAPAGRPVRGALIRGMQRAVGGGLRELRRGQVAALREAAAGTADAGGRGDSGDGIEFINGGGTGSIESTGADPSITELAAGSGLYAPLLFDDYARFSPRPALGFPASVVRVPAEGVVTVAGAGWVASGPAGADRLPRPVWPEGLRYVASEGPGEVQTPLRGARGLGLGDRVWFRPAKAGETCERVNEILVVRGEEILARVPTYRGEGKVFL